MIVLKFGGTSVRDGAAINRAAEVVAARQDRGPVVVASAMAGVTDQLIDAAEVAGRHELPAALEIVETLRGRHAEALAETCDGEAQRCGAERLEHVFQDLTHTLDALALLEASGPRGVDAVIAQGELLSTTILAAALEGLDVPTRWVDARNIIVTDATFGRAVPDVPATAIRALDELTGSVAAGVVPVTQGFIGATERGITTTLGRGGSDLTATLLGAVLGVDEVQIWTDVPGLLTADPRVVPGARSVPEATYDEAAELAYFGAKVLHPATMVPVIEAGIPLLIKNSTDPDAPGTRISPATPPDAAVVKSIASKRGVTIIFLKAPRMLGVHGFLRRMFEIFDRHGVAVDVVATSEISVSLSVERGAVTPALLDELEALGHVEIRHDRAVLCVVGSAMRETPGVAARIFKAIAPVNVEMISQGASKVNVTLVIHGSQAADAVRQLHDEFFPAS